MESIEQFEKESYKDLCVPFYKFDSPALFYDWAVSTDEQVGGESNGTLAFSEEGQYAEVKGKLVEERNNLLQQRMYVGLACDFLQRLNVKNYNGIRMKIKTDGNLYKMHITCSSDYDMLHDAYSISKKNIFQYLILFLGFQYRHNIRMANCRSIKLLYLIIYMDQILFFVRYHLADFWQKSLKDKILLQEFEIQQVKFMQSFIYDKFILKGLSIVSESEEEKPFQFQIKSIDMIYRHDFNKVLAKYKRPFFFKSQESYDQLEYLDVGNTVLQLRNESNMAQMQKTTVNEVMNPKEVKQFVSFKDKINQRNQNQQN